MNYDEFATKVKAKYPQYQDMDNKTLATKMVAKYPEYKDVTFEDQKTNWPQVIGSAAKRSFTVPIAAAKDLGTNPQTMANVMPALLGTAGGVSPVPGGATMGTAAGQGIRDLALGSLKKPIPGLMQHGIELGGAALGDIAAIPAIKRSIFGGQIGKAERAAGIVTRPPMKAVTPGSVGQTLNDLEAQLDAGMINTPQAARDAQAVMKQVYKNPKIYEQTDEISVAAQRVADKVSKVLNSPTMVPGRAVPNAAFSKASTIPNAIGKGYMSMPWALRHGAEAALGWEGVKKIIQKLMGQ